MQHHKSEFWSEHELICEPRPLELALQVQETRGDTELDCLLGLHYLSQEKMYMVCRPHDVEKMCLQEVVCLAKKYGSP